jgi:hypothetical protein
MKRSQLQTAAAAVACGGLALLAAGCGSGSPAAPGVAQAGTGTTAHAGTTTAAKTDLAAYSRCMRANGVPSFPDPDSQGRLTIRATPGSPLAPDSPTMKAAAQKCRALQPKHEFDPGDLKKIETQALKFSACMRSHGVPKFPDPKVSGDGIQLRITGIDPSSPTFKAAQQACRSLAPGAAGGADGGPGKVSVGGS